MKVLSLFDGMACGMIAMQLAGVDVESYDAYEIDKYAIKTAQHNFPMIKEHGDVFDADFTQHEGVDFLIGGSPCTYWSIAQTKNRETVASGMGWALLSQYVRALHEAKPKHFIYENNKSMSKDIRASIDKVFGFEAVCINSALVSAQNRQRLYWVGRRNEDGTYSKVNVEQPADRGILLKDVLDSAVLKSNQIIEPVCVEERGRMYCGQPQHHEARTNGKTNTITSVEKDNRVAEPINPTSNGKAQCLRATCYKDGIRNIIANGVDKKTGVAEFINDICQVGAMPRPDGEISASAGFRIYSTEAKGRYLCANGGGAGAKTGLYAIPTMPVKIGDVGNGGQGNRVYSVNGKGVAQTAQSGGIGSNTGLYAIPYSIEFNDDGRPIKSIGKDGKEITIYKVRDGKITVKGKQYPIKLKDGFYIIRKLTVSECKRLQTVPEWYEFPVSNSQAYKMLGNGWTCEVIAHILKYLKEA